MAKALPLLIASVLATSAVGQSRRYVDDTAQGANDGTSWTDAFTDLRAAIAATPNGGEIWVAVGTYLPSRVGDRWTSFEPKLQQRIYGGFAGTETSLADRAGLYEDTVLSGDLLGDDDQDFAHRDDNSEHVLRLFYAVDALVDGFTIRGGHATVSAGGGAWFGEFLSSAKARNCTFIDNEARRAGGAAYTDRDVIDLFESCRFLGNRAGTGGAVFQQPNGKGFTVVQRCRLLGNVATRGGGGAFAGGSADLADCLVAGNRADETTGGGGAILGRVTVLRCTVYENRALGGPLVGGIHGAYQTIGCILWGNEDDRGAVARAQFEPDPQFPGELDGCCIEGWSPGLGGTRVISADPEFVDPLGPDGLPGTQDDDLRLGKLSPCIDVLPAMLYAEFDLLGRPRTFDSRKCAEGVLDLGALERQSIDVAPTFCPATPSSLGSVARLEAPCLLELGGGAVEVLVAPVPIGTGFLLASSSRTELPFGNGILCMGGEVLVSPANSSQGNVLRFSFDPADFGGRTLAGGASWNLQAIYRDPAAGGAGANSSEALAVTILP